MYNINSEVLEYRPKVYGFVEFLVLAELWLSKQEGMRVQLRFSVTHRCKNLTLFKTEKINTNMKFSKKCQNTGTYFCNTF